MTALQKQLRRAQEIKELTGVSVCEQMWIGYMRNEGIAKMVAMRQEKTTAEERDVIDELAAQNGLVVTYQLDPEIVAKLRPAAT